MTETVYSVYGRGRNHDWTCLTNLRPKTEAEAQQKVDACRRSQPTWEFKWTVTEYDTEGPTDDIPF